MKKNRHSAKKKAVGRKTVRAAKKPVSGRRPVKYNNDTDHAFTVSEPSFAYGMQIPVSSNPMKAVWQKTESQMTSIEKMNIVRSGVTKQYLEKFKNKAALDYDKLSKGLSIARATLINKKGKEKFSSSISEKILGLADIYSYGYEVFGEESRFNEWMFRTNLALGKQTPYDLIDNQFGREEIKDLIGRIAYGVYS